MSETKGSYESGMSIAEMLKTGIIDELSKMDSREMYGTAKYAAASPIEYRNSPDSRDIGLLVYVTQDNWDRLCEIIQVSGLSMDEVISRMIGYYYPEERLYRR